jgi:MscS family membrane protein
MNEIITSITSIFSFGDINDSLRAIIVTCLAIIANVIAFGIIRFLIRRDFLALGLVRRLFSRFLSRLTGEGLSDDIAQYIKRNAGMATVILLITVMAPLVPYFGYSESIEVFIAFAFKTTVSINFTLLIYRLLGTRTIESILIFISSKIKLQADFLVSFLIKILKGLVAVFGAIMTLQNAGVNVTAFLAGISIAGLALALAAQDTVKNFFGSLTIHIDHPFAKGDIVTIDAHKGKVSDIGLRSTVIVTADGASITIPNGKISDSIVKNHTAELSEDFADSIYKYTNLDIPISLSAKCPTESLRRLKLELLRVMKEYNGTQSSDDYSVVLESFAGNAVVVRCKCVLKHKDKDAGNEKREQLNFDILELIQKHELEII